MTDRMIPQAAVAALCDVKIEALEAKIARMDERGQTNIDRDVILQCAAAMGALRTLKSHLRFICTDAELAAGGEFPIDDSPASTTVSYGDR